MSKSEVERLGAALARSQSDMDQLTNAVSHELRGPLNIIIGYLDLVELQEAGADPAETRRFIDAARDGATRLNRRLDAILELSRVRADPRDGESVDLERLWRGVVEAMDDPIVRLGASISFGSLPTVKGNGRQLTLAAHHLLDNALAWRGPASPRVSISVVQTADAWALAVSDNGRGVRTDHSERIFEMFQQFGSTRGSEGAGLTIARRVFRRHGGDLQLSSSSESGSTFVGTIALDGGEAGSSG